jgi:hypothetical protein
MEHIIVMPKLSTQRKATKTPKRNRLQQRATDEQRDLIQRGADIEGPSVTDFMLRPRRKKPFVLSRASRLFGLMLKKAGSLPKR